MISNCWVLKVVVLFLSMFTWTCNSFFHLPTIKHGSSFKKTQLMPCMLADKKIDSHSQPNQRKFYDKKDNRPRKPMNNDRNNLINEVLQDYQNHPGNTASNDVDTIDLFTIEEKGINENSIFDQSHRSYHKTDPKGNNNYKTNNFNNRNDKNNRNDRNDRYDKNNQRNHNNQRRQQFSFLIPWWMEDHALENPRALPPYEPWWLTDNFLVDESWTVEALRTEALRRNLSKTGNKHELIEKINRESQRYFLGNENYFLATFHPISSNNETLTNENYQPGIIHDLNTLQNTTFNKPTQSITQTKHSNKKSK